MTWQHECFKEPHVATASGPLTATKGSPTASDGDSRALHQSYAIQAIHTAANDLLDCAMQADTLDDALELARTVKFLRERIDAIADRALQKANELCG